MGAFHSGEADALRQQRFIEAYDEIVDCLARRRPTAHLPFGGAPVAFDRARILEELGQALGDDADELIAAAVLGTAAWDQARWRVLFLVTQWAYELADVRGE